MRKEPYSVRTNESGILSMEAFLRGTVLLLRIVWTLSTLQKSEAGSCRTLTIKHIFNDRALTNHIIRTIQPIADTHTCATSCYLEPLCFSYNFCQKPNEAPRCELSKFEHIRKISDLKRDPECTYYGAVSWCAKNLCRNGATCLGDFFRENVKYQCICRQGFHGEQCQYDFNECKTGKHNCHKNAICINIPGRFYCNCKKGYSGNGTYCEDVNECSLSVPPCHVNATCNNTIGGYNCTCKAGFIGNGKQCKDINECLPKPYVCGKLNVTCSNTKRTVRWKRICTQKNCTKVNGNDNNATGSMNCTECTVHSNHNNATGTMNCTECTVHSNHDNATGLINCKECKMQGDQNNTTCIQSPVHGNHSNATGSMKCPGCTIFSQNNTNSDDDEGDSECYYEEEAVTFNDTSIRICEEDKICFNYSHGCHAMATCSNDIGSYHCNCKAGFQGNGTVCTDINECASNISVCHTNATCTNTIGGYICTCKEGFQGNGRQCYDEECDATKHGCHVNATCRNTITGHICRCKEGFYGNGTQCYDVDECTAEKHGCHVNATCENTIGGHNCTCKVGFHGNGTQCYIIDECERNIYSCHAKASCRNLAGGYTCMCKHGFKGNGTFCEDIDECATNAHDCHVNALCENTIGGYKCSCKLGLYGNGTFCREPEDCSELATNMPDEAKSTLYQIKPKGLTYSVFCMMSNVGCGSGTWKLALKINSKLQTFNYDSPLWTNYDFFKQEAAQTGLDNKETKTEAYWSVPMKRMCFGMKIASTIRWKTIFFNPGMHSLSAFMKTEGSGTNFGYSWWSALVPSPSTHKGCFREGVNLNIKKRALRLGFFASKKRLWCGYYESYVGLGPRLDYFPPDAPICGNYAPSDASYGGRKTHAFCYILVQS